MDNNDYIIQIAEAAEAKAACNAIIEAARALQDEADVPELVSLLRAFQMLDLFLGNV